VTTERFMEVMKDKELHEYVWSQARRHSKRDELAEEFVQEAWLCISTAPNDWDNDSLKQLIYKSIYSSYWQNKKELLMLWPKRQAKRTSPPRSHRYVGSERDEKNLSHNWRD
jgi:predicted ribosome quality control (RQC) complex YloA/Tae2 family protein